MSDQKVKVLRPKASRFELGLNEIWEYRELLYFLTWRQIKTKYKQTAIGVAWVVIQPLITTAIFALIFYNVGNLSAGVPKAWILPALFSTLMLWTFFSAALNAGSFSLISNNSMISKVYFPRLLLPLAMCIAGLLDYGIAWVILILMMAIVGAPFSVMVVFIAIPLMLTFLLASGLTFFFSAMAAKYRDVQYIVPFFISILLFASPILYPVTWYSNQTILWLAYLNPLTGIMSLQRYCVFGTPAFDILFLISGVIVTVGIFVAGLLYFKRYERELADVI